MWQTFCVIITLLVICQAREKPKPMVLNEKNWTDILEGEWMVKFYAPWCPACKALAPVWEEVASWSEDVNFKVGMVDVTENPGLSGRFMVMALPTIFHVKDGEFRVYRGSREENDLVSFVDDKKWQSIAAIPWYRSPSSLHMSGLSLFFKLSLHIRNVHASMTEEYGVPVWGSYIIFAIVTIIIGLLLGVLIVFLCDVVWPPQHPPSMQPSRYDAPWSKTKLPDDLRDTEGDVIEDDTIDKAPSTLGKGEPDATAGTRKRKVKPTKD